MSPLLLQTLEEIRSGRRNSLEGGTPFREGAGKGWPYLPGDHESKGTERRDLPLNRLGELRSFPGWGWGEGVERFPRLRRGHEKEEAVEEDIHLPEVSSGRGRATRELSFYSDDARQLDIDDVT